VYRADSKHLIVAIPLLGHLYDEALYAAGWCPSKVAPPDSVSMFFGNADGESDMVFVNSKLVIEDCP